MASKLAKHIRTTTYSWGCYYHTLQEYDSQCYRLEGHQPFCYRIKSSDFRAHSFASGRDIQKSKMPWGRFPGHWVQRVLRQFIV